jgi:hypothetical protein
MGFFKRLFAHKTGGTRAGNFVRNFINSQTFGISDAMGLTDGHVNGGKGGSSYSGGDSND